jgi:hypothetical protein
MAAWMAHKDKGPVVFLLCQESTGSHRDGSSASVPRGSLLSPVKPSTFKPNVAVTMYVQHMPGVLTTVYIKDLQQVAWPQAELLAAVHCLDTRHVLLSSPKLRIKLGDTVLYFAPEKPPIHATVRYLGPVPEWSPAGHLLGLEAVDPAWKQGSTDGSTIMNRYFRTNPRRGVFCNLNRIGLLAQKETAASNRSQQVEDQPQAKGPSDQSTTGIEEQLKALKDIMQAERKEQKREMVEQKQETAAMSRTIETLTNAIADLTTTVRRTATLHVECPICMEEARPPMRLQQCEQGHILCDSCSRRCSRRGVGSACPSCQGPLTDRPIALERQLGLF